MRSDDIPLANFVSQGFTDLHCSFLFILAALYKHGLNVIPMKLMLVDLWDDFVWDTFAILLVVCISVLLAADGCIQCSPVAQHKEANCWDDIGDGILNPYKKGEGKLTTQKMIHLFHTQYP